MVESMPWGILSEVYAFLGNSLLAPMSQTSHVGLDPSFWYEFPDFDDSDIAGAVAECAAYAENAARRENEGRNAVQEVSVEYTKLFVGPPSPSAAPWETMYRSDTNIGFGEATIQMRALLRDSGLQLKNENHQYEDHMGIELLFLSNLCLGRAGVGATSGESNAVDGMVFTFIETHPLAWIGEFRDRIIQAFPDGYFVRIVGLAESFLRYHAEMLVR